MKLICVIALVLACIVEQSITANNFVSGFQGGHGIYGWNISPTGSIIEQQYQLAPNTKICGKVYYFKTEGKDKSAACYVNSSGGMVCYEKEKDCMDATTWVTGADSDDDRIVLEEVLTVPGNVCTKNYWRVTPEADIQNLYCFTNVSSGLMCYDDRKQCLVAANSRIRNDLEAILLERITNVDTQVCTRNYYIRGSDVLDAYCWTADPQGQQCWIDVEHCLDDVELQVTPSIN